MVLDSPYQDLSQLIREKAQERAGILGMLASPLLYCVGSALRENHGL
jgi:hypothetical protein